MKKHTSKLSGLSNQADSSLKTRIILLFHQVLINNLFSPITYIGLCAIESLMIIFFAITVAQNTEFHDTMSEFTIVLALQDYLSVNTQYIFMATLTGIGIIFPLIAFYLSPACPSEVQKVNYFTSLFFKAFSMYITLLLRPLSLFLEYFYFNILTCNAESDCYQATHLVYAIVCVFGFISSFCTLYVTVYLLPADCYPESPQPWAGTMSFIGLFRMSTKAIIAISLVLNFKYGVIALLPYLYFAYQRSICKQYIYNKYVLAQGIILDATTGLFGIGMTICAFFSLELSLLGLILILVASGILSYAFLIYKEIKISRILESPLNRIKDPNDLTVFFLKILKAAKNMTKSSKERQRIWAAICNHMETCNTANCECKDVASKLKDICKAAFHIGEYREEEIEKFQNRKPLIKKFIGIILKDALDMYGDLIEIRLLASYIEDYKLDNYIKGYYNVMKAEEIAPSFAGELAIYMHRNTIELNITSKKQDQGLDVKGIWQFDKLYQNLINSITVAARKCIDFWAELLQLSINIGRLYKKSIRISELYLSITTTVQEMLEIYPDHTGLLRDYAYFLSDVVNNDIEACEFMDRASTAEKKAKIMKGDTNYEEIKYGYNSTAVTLTASGNIDSTGVVQNSNDNIKQFGYQKSDVIGNNVSVILPKFLGDMHDSFIYNYYNTGVASFLNRERIVFIKHKSGFLEPVYLLVKCLPNLQEGLQFLGFIKKLPLDSPYLHPPQKYLDKKYMIIVTDSKGYILGFSKSCFKKLGLVMGLVNNNASGTSSNQDETGFSIKELCPDLMNPKIEEKLMRDGAELIIRTESILSKVEFEQLSQNEATVLSHSIGSYRCYVQLVNHIYKNVSFKIYKVAILNRENRNKTSTMMVPFLQMKQGIDQQYLKVSAAPITKAKKAKAIPELMGLDSSVENNSSIQGSSLGTTSSSFTKAVKEFKKQITSNITPKSIIYLNRAVIILLFLLIGLSIFDMVMKLQFANDYIDEMKAISISNNRRFILQDMCAKLRSIVNIAAGIEKPEVKGEGRLERLIPGIKSDLDELQRIQLQLDANKFDITEDLKNMVKTRSIVLQTLDANCKVENVKVTMSTAIGQVISYTSQIINNQNLDLKNDDLPLLRLGGGKCTSSSLLGRAAFFVLENCFGPLRVIAMQAGLEYTRSSLLNSERDKMYLTIIMICCVLFVVICVVIAIPILVRAERNKVIALSIYSQLPVENAKKMLIKCKKHIEKREGMLSSERSGNSKQTDEMLISNNKSNTQNTSENNKEKQNTETNQNTDKEIQNQSQLPKPLDLTKKDEKTPLLSESQGTPNPNLNNQEQNNLSNQVLIGHEEAFHKFRTNIARILIVLLILASIILGYVGVSYYIAIKEFKDSTIAFEQIRDLTGRIPALVLMITYLREMIIRNEVYYFQGKDMLDEALEFQIDREKLIKSMKEQPSNVILNTMEFLRRLDSHELCDIVTTSDEQKKECLEIGGKVLANGVKNAIYYYINLVITTRQQFNSMDLTTRFYSLYNMLNDDERLYMFIAKDRYINPAMWKLQDMIFDDALDYYTNMKTIDIAKTTAFIVAVLLIIGVIWNSFITNLKTEVFRARGILNLIPTDFILSHDSIRKEVMRIISF